MGKRQLKNQNGVKANCRRTVCCFCFFVLIIFTIRPEGKHSNKTVTGHSQEKKRESIPSMQQTTFP
jgi:hypothetical protein